MILNYSVQVSCGNRKMVFPSPVGANDFKLTLEVLEVPASEEFPSPVGANDFKHSNPNSSNLARSEKGFRPLSGLMILNTHISAQNTLTLQAGSRPLSGPMILDILQTSCVARKTAGSFRPPVGANDFKPCSGCALSQVG